MEACDGVHAGRGKKAGGMDENRGPPGLSLGSDHSEKDW